MSPSAEAVSDSANGPSREEIALQKSYVKYREMRKVLDAVTDGFKRCYIDGFVGGIQYSEFIKEMESDRPVDSDRSIDLLVQDRTQVCLGFPCEKGHPHFNKRDPDACHFYPTRCGMDVRGP